MRRIYQTAAIVLFLSSVAFAQKSHRAFVSRAEQAVRQIEDQVSAALDHNDADALDRLWAADYMFVNPFGIVMTKAQRLSLFRSGKLKLESYSRDQENIRIYGETAIVIYRSTVKGQRGSQDIGFQRRVTTVLMKRSGHWRVVSQQSTRIEQQ